MRIILAEEMQKYANGVAEVEVQASTPATAISALLNTYPQLYMFLLGTESAANRYACIIDDELFLDKLTSTQVATTLEFVEVPSGEIGEAIAVGLMGLSGTIGTVVGIVINLVVSIGISLLMGMLTETPTSAAPTEGSVGSSSAYSFKGVSNTTAPGTVIPIVYGTHRVGGQVLAVSTHSEERPSIMGDNVIYYDKLKAVIAVSEGPIKKIDNMLVAGFPTNYYNGWKDRTKPFSYSKGQSEVTEVVTKCTTTDDGYWDGTGNVDGDLTPYNRIENTNSSVNNTKIQSIKSSIKSFREVQPTDWNIGTTLTPVQGTLIAAVTDLDGRYPKLGSDANYTYRYINAVNYYTGGNLPMPWWSLGDSFNLVTAKMIKTAQIPTGQEHLYRSADLNMLGPFPYNGPVTQNWVNEYATTNIQYTKDVSMVSRTSAVPKYVIYSKKPCDSDPYAEATPYSLKAYANIMATSAAAKFITNRGFITTGSGDSIKHARWEMYWRQDTVDINDLITYNTTVKTYSDVSVAVTQGSTTVTGTSTTFVTAGVKPGGTFKIAGQSNKYTISSIVSETSLILTSPYTGATLTNSAYEITWNHTTNIDEILNSSSITKINTTTRVVGVRLQLVCPVGLYIFKKTTGEYLTKTVPIGIFYRSKEIINDPWKLLAMETIAGKTRGEIVRDYEGPAMPEDTYEIAVIRFDVEDPTSFSIVADVRIKALTEYIAANVGYPYTAIIGFTLRATDQLSGSLPSISTLVTGRIIQVPDKDENGLFKIDTLTNKIIMRDAMESELNNPVWCLFDLLTNTRYGMGDYYPIADSKYNIVVANFDFNAQYCDTLVDYTDEDGVVQTRKRFTLNLVIDQSKSAADWVETIKAIIRANLYYSQGLFWVEIDQAKLITQLFNMSNIAEYTQSGASYHNTPNVIEVQWPNPRIDYAMDVFRVETPEFMENPSVQENKKVMNMVGVTDLEQAKSLVKYAFNKSKLTKQVSFKTGTEGIRCQANDVIGISHDIPKWGAGGRITACTVDSDICHVTVDNEIVPADVTGNKFYIMDYKGDVHTVTSTSISSTGFIYMISTNGNYVPNLSSVVDQEHLDAFSYGVAQFKVISIQKDTDIYSTITALEYSSDIYALCDDTSDMSTIIPQDYSQLPVPYKTSVDNVQVETVSRLVGTVFRSVLNISFTTPQGTSYASADVYISSTDALNYSRIVTDSTTNHIEYVTTEANGEYSIVVTANYTTRRQSLAEALQDENVVNKAVVIIADIPASEEFTGGVTGLCIENKGNDETFLGKDCVLVWRKPLVVDISVPAGEEEGAGVGQTNSLLSYYLLKVTSPDGGLRRQVQVPTERFAYTHEMNHEDGITRNFLVTVTAWDIFGRSSEPVTIACYNPAPAKIQT